MNCRFHPAAEAEHLETVVWYETRKAGLGAQYLAELERTLEQIRRDPGRFPIESEPGIRRAIVRQFPFSVLFRAVEGQVDILAVAHHRRRPGYWIVRV